MSVTAMLPLEERGCLCFEILNFGYHTSCRFCNFTFQDSCYFSYSSKMQCIGVMSMFHEDLVCTWRAESDVALNQMPLNDPHPALHLVSSPAHLSSPLLPVLQTQSRSHCLSFPANLPIVLICNRKSLVVFGLCRHHCPPCTDLCPRWRVCFLGGAQGLSCFTVSSLH